jgi:hypothetical protein
MICREIALRGTCQPVSIDTPEFRKCFAKWFKILLKTRGSTMYQFRSRIKLFKGRNLKSDFDVVILKYNIEHAEQQLSYVENFCNSVCNSGLYGFFTYTAPFTAKPRVMSQSTKDALAKSREDAKHSKGLPPAAKEAQKAKAN